MPLFRGAASKVILAHIPRRKLRRYFDEFAPEVSAIGLGDDWEGFKARLREIRNADVYVTRGEVDPGRVGLAAPIFSSEGEIIASIGLVVRDVDFAANGEVASGLRKGVGAAAQTITATLRSLTTLDSSTAGEDRAN
jgi:DNA-binding IclR family transcriptional regulator